MSNTPSEPVVRRPSSVVPGAPRRAPGAFGSLVRKEAAHIFRDRKTLVVLLLMPVVQVLLFGFAIRTDVRDVRVAVVDPARDVRSRALVAELAAAPTFRVVAEYPTAAPLASLLRRGGADAAVVLPPRFAETLGRGGAAQVLIVTDNTNATYGQTVQAFLTQSLRRWERAHGGGRARVVVRPVARMRFNPTLESANLFVPGLLAFVLTIVSALMTSISIAREKETGTMEVLLVSPLRPGQIVVAKVVPYLGLAFLNAVTTLFVARVVFAVPLAGSLLLLLAECLLYVLVSLALGVLVSTRAPDQRSAMMLVLLGMMMPTMALSGFVFPIASMPDWLQPVTNVVPATWFIVIARGIMLKGVGLETLWQETLILAGMAVVLLGLSARGVKDRLE
ncbi:MAG TPA: ABC transporter permease [Rhodothermales bacterium]|nr:ABC transporter permease [Rhodothermales bacterium]